VIAGRYSLDQEIGRGGMGAVWRGTDHTLGRTVALKRVGHAPGGADTDVRRAEREARLAARLNHPHVVAVFDLVDESPGGPGDLGQQWMVMEYVEGTTLSQIVKANGALLPDQVAPILAQVADALAAAHTAGIVHRDVKPSNILVADDGQVKLTDFGIARAEADAALTQTGLVTGSPAYLAPEVATGRTATEASDVWSLGATLCHALTGKPPYEVGDGPAGVMGTLYRIVNDDPPRPGTAGWLAPLLAATMEKDPARRWSAAQARDFLRAGPTAVTPTPVPAASEHTRTLETVPVAPASPPSATTAPPPAHGRAGRVTAIVLGVLVVLALTVAAFLAGLDGDEEPAGDPSAGASSGTPSDEPTPSPSSAPTAAEMEQFVRDYLALVVDDPESAFERLTPAFQDVSGGLEGYLDFWGKVTSTRVQSVSADPERLVVDYRYVRREEGSRRAIPDSVSLRLEQLDGRLLIAGEA
jgi:eukaryotic-like serine/threonine-protein kinase